MKEKWTPQQEQFVKDHYQQGDGLQECALFCGRTLYSTKQKARRLGVSGSRRNFSEVELQFIKENHQFLGYKKIADILGVKACSLNTLCHKCHRELHFGKRGELLETPTASGEDNQQPSRSNVVSIVDRKVQRLTGEDTQTNNPDTSAPLSVIVNGLMI